MIRRVFIVTSAVSLLLCFGTAVLWVHGRGRTAGWYFRPSKSFIIQPPDPSLPSKWCVQWLIGWGNDGQLSINRQERPAESDGVAPVRIAAGPLRIGYFTAVIQPIRWSPIPPSLPAIRPPSTSPVVHRYGDGAMMVEYPPTKTSTTARFLRAEYTSREQEFAHFSEVAGLPERYIAYPGGRFLRVPLLYLFILFAVLPCIWTWRTVRAWRRHPPGHCQSCGYNLTGNTSGVCPECGIDLKRMPAVSRGGFSEKRSSDQ